MNAITTKTIQNVCLSVCLHHQAFSNYYFVSCRADFKFTSQNVIIETEAGSSGDFIIKLALHIPEGTPLSDNSLTAGVIEASNLLSLLSQKESELQLAQVLGQREFTVSEPPTTETTTGGDSGSLPIGPVAGGAGGGIIILILIIILIYFKSVPFYLLF